MNSLNKQKHNCGKKRKKRANDDSNFSNAILNSILNYGGESDDKDRRERKHCVCLAVQNIEIPIEVFKNEFPVRVLTDVIHFTDVLILLRFSERQTGNNPGDKATEEY